MIGRQAYRKSFTGRDINLLARANVTLLKNDELLIFRSEYRMKYFCKGAFEKILLAKDRQSNEPAIEVTGRQNDVNSSAQTKIEQLEKELAKLRNKGAGATSVVQDGIQIRITKAEANGPRGEAEGEVLSKNVIDRVTFDDEPLKLKTRRSLHFRHTFRMEGQPLSCVQLTLPVFPPQLISALTEAMRNLQYYHSIN